MNNNRGNNNNRRRGRGNNNRQQGGGQQTNRIDSRARGNAPQMLEKYRKLAHDAHLNGDRVTEEYNLQFADHYFRVIADQKQRQDDSRQPRRDDRLSEYGDDFAAAEYDPYGETPSMPATHADRGPRQEREQRGDQQQREPREQRQDRYEREPRAEAAAEQATEVEETGSEEAAQAPGSVYEPPENPFIRDNRGPGRGLKQRKPRRPRDDEAGEGQADAVSQDVSEEPGGNFDAAVLPPAISARPARKPKAAPAEQPSEGAEASAEPAGEEKPRRRRTRKPSADDAGATPETVNG
ncbi:DUF4167 domain-containing protein [Novosphingobium sp. AP12]|uniref:DUF4167 domain-containing protein n=1 Tax=Novosphingobium sp. AP12 TaxID=1144305 RepID=UPI000271FB8B|nr:DUF4167 domain-containing protein [Novosphingobium sp. AP12]EJL24098.1 hypothetical protein PMI02_03805 [Novosphingobium sp. AP12]